MKSYGRFTEMFTAVSVDDDLGELHTHWLKFTICRIEMIVILCKKKKFLWFNNETTFVKRRKFIFKSRKLKAFISIKFNW
jgi:hypothetical protein